MARGSFRWLLTRYVFWLCFVLFFLSVAITKNLVLSAKFADSIMEWINVILGTANLVIWRKRSKQQPSESGAVSAPPSSSPSDSSSTS